MDWVEVYESHTPYEWQQQVAASVVDPWGDDRADLRAEANTFATVAPSEDSLGRLTSYLAIDQHTEPVGPAAMRQYAESGG